MNRGDILAQRLLAQHLEGELLDTPQAVVRHLGVVQSQDFGGALWAVAQRTKTASKKALEAAIADGTILRTHIMRPTWHFVAAEDILWIAELTKDRLLQALSYYFRKLELSEAILSQTDSLLCDVLTGNKQLTRSELATALASQKVDVNDPLRLGHMIIHAEANGLICSGAPRGKQQTYALVSERAPQAKIQTRPAALAELARRYFVGHGPATLADFAWWSGLTKADAKTGIQAIVSELQSVELDGKTFWFGQNTPQPTSAPKAHLLPNYDEYIVAFADREGLFDQAHAPMLDSRQNPLFNNTLVIDGAIAGTWKKTERRGRIEVSITPFRTFSAAEQVATDQAVAQYTQYATSEQL